MHREYKNPGIALVLAFLSPGAGQFYNGHIGKGILFLLTFWRLIPWVWSLFDAYTSAQRINAQGYWALRSRSYPPRDPRNRPGRQGVEAEEAAARRAPG